MLDLLPDLTNNGPSMTRWRLALIGWLVCALPLGAVAAPYGHVHADADHSTAHHDGGTFHQHGPNGHGDDHASGESHESSVLILPVGLVTSGPALVHVSTTPSLLQPRATMAQMEPVRWVQPPEDQSPPGDPPAPRSFERGPPR